MKKRSFRSTFVSVILVITVAISIVNLVCMLPGRTFKNDMLSRRLETGEQIRITRGCKK